MSPDTFSVVARALGFVVLLQAAGVALFLAALGDRLEGSLSAIRCVGRRLAVAATPLLVMHYALEAARMADDWTGVFDPNLQRMVLASPASAVLAMRLLGLGTVAIACRRNAGAYLRTAAVAGALLIAASFAFTGHTATHPWRALLAPLLMTHVLIVAFWIGSLLSLFLATTREKAPRVGQVFEAFSAIAIWAVPVIGVAGLVMTVTLVRHLDVFLEPYGWLLIGKVLAFTALLGIGALNRWLLGPAVAMAAEGASRAFRHSLAAEYALIAGVLMATAILTSFFSPDLP